MYSGIIWLPEKFELYVDLFPLHITCHRHLYIKILGPRNKIQSEKKHDTVNSSAQVNQELSQISHESLFLLDLLQSIP